MMTRAETLYAWIWRTFGTRPFSIFDFELTFPAPRPHRTLSELKLRGYVERVGRGTYRAVPPERWVERRASLRPADAERALAEAPWPYCFTAETAVRIWTSGRYAAGSTPAYHALHVAVRARDVPRWKRFLAAAGIAAREAEIRGTGAGIEVILHRRRAIAASRVGGLPVDPKPRVLAFVRRNASIFAPAEEMIRRA